MRNLTKIALFLLIVLAVAFGFPHLSTTIFPPVPKPSGDFDCDDDALAMYNHFQSLGIESTPIIGNLKKVGEGYLDCDHVWLLVKSGDKEIAYDWGSPRFDSQHYEGYTISLEYLKEIVAQDHESEGQIASLEP
jgi:hypothetical protein